MKLPKRWVVERTLAWIGRCRRNSRDYHLYPHSGEATIIISSNHIMLRRLKPAKFRPWSRFKLPEKSMNPYRIASFFLLDSSVTNL